MNRRADDVTAGSPAALQPAGLWSTRCSCLGEKRSIRSHQKSTAASVRPGTTGIRPDRWEKPAASARGQLAGARLALRASPPCALRPRARRRRPADTRVAAASPCFRLRDHGAADILGLRLFSTDHEADLQAFPSPSLRLPSCVPRGFVGILGWCPTTARREHVFVFGTGTKKCRLSGGTLTAVRRFFWPQSPLPPSLMEVPQPLNGSG